MLVFFFAIDLFQYAMRFRAEDPKLQLGFWDQFKEFDEKI
jgi:hypothetical protein